MTEDMHVDDAASADGQPVAAEPEPQYGVGPFSIREVVITGIWLVAFVLSFLPVFGGGTSLWGLGLTWVLTIGVPTVAVFLLVLRRLSPEGIRRVGSLGIDQFASVAFSVAAVSWLTFVWQQVSIAVVTGMGGLGGWLVWLEFLLMLAGVVCTVLAPVIPGLREDFRHRPESVAHPNARRLRPIAPRPPRPAPAPWQQPAPGVGFQQPGPDFRQQVPLVGPGAAPAADTVTAVPEHRDAAETAVLPPYAQDAPAAQPVAGTDPVVDVEPVAAEPAPDADPTAVGDEPAAAEPATTEPAQEAPTDEHARPVAQAFWALVPEERDVLDETGAPIFRIGPTAWALVIEDRGEVFVIRHEDGRIGYLHDVSGVTRG